MIPVLCPKRINKYFILNYYNMIVSSKTSLHNDQNHAVWQFSLFHYCQ